jgi:ureidoacrylate peracid hydrolase
MMPDTSFLQKCAFVCVDLQPVSRTPLVTIPDEWKQMGITLEDAIAAFEYYHRECLPNARRVADACRRLKLPMIFVHWGYRYKDAMDLAPVIRKSFLEEFGPDYSRWPHHIDSPESRPADELGVREGEYVLPKSDQDTFTSSNIHFMLQNLGIKNIVFVGGHTGACLGKTAASAKRLGYRTMCIEDATNDAAQSRRIPNILATGYDYILITDAFLKLTAQV